MKIKYILLFLTILFFYSCRNTVPKNIPKPSYSLSNRFDEWSLVTIENLEFMKHDTLHSLQTKRLIDHQNMVKGSLMRKNLLNFLDSVKILYPNYDSLLLSEKYLEGEVSSYYYGLIVCINNKYIYYNLYQYAFDRNPKITNKKIISQKQFSEFVKNLENYNPTMKCRPKDYMGSRFFCISLFTKTDIKVTVFPFPCSSDIKKMYEPLREE